MSSTEKAPFTDLQEHPWIGADRGHEFFEIPERYDLLIRGADTTGDIPFDLQRLQAQRELLGHLNTDYEIGNSGFSPVYAEGRAYVVTDIIPGFDLQTLVEAGKPQNIKIGDRLLNRLIDYSSDLIENGGMMAGDIYGFDQYAVREGEAVIVDLDIEPIPLSSDNPEKKMVQLLDAQLANMTRMAIALAIHEPEVMSAKRLLSLLEGLDGPTPEIKNMLEITITALKQKDPKSLKSELYGFSDWREYADSRP